MTKNIHARKDTGRGAKKAPRPVYVLILNILILTCSSRISSLPLPACGGAAGEMSVWAAYMPERAGILLLNL